MGREFFVAAQTLIEVKLLTSHDDCIQVVALHVSKHLMRASYEIPIDTKLVENAACML